MSKSRTIKKVKLSPEVEEIEQPITTKMKTEIIENISSASSEESSSEEEYCPKPTKRKVVKKSITQKSKRITKKECVSEDISEGEASKPKRRKIKKISSDNETEQKPKKVKLKREKAKPDTEKLNSLIKSEMNSNSQFDMEWTETQFLCETHNIDEQVASNVIQLFDQENTIPFIARYRRNMTGGMEAEILRALMESYNRAKTIKQRASTILKSVDKLGKWTPNIHALIKSAKSLNTLEYINSLFKVPGKRSLSEKAKQLGLGDISEKILNGKPISLLSNLINPSIDGLKNEKEIKNGIIHILADIINKDKVLFDKIQNLRKNAIAYIQVSQRKNATDEVKAKIKEEGKLKKADSEEKYENYYDFKSRSDTIKPYQILAINRGENHKFLTVKLSISYNFENTLRREFQKIYSKSLQVSQMHNSLLMESFEYAYKKNIEPALIRRFRNELNEQAETASIEVFGTNLKQLLLAPPFRGKTILGIDPGFYHGCKLAMVSETGEVLATDVIYLPQIKNNQQKKLDISMDKLINLVKEYNCSTIALGNGTACRETEVFLTDLIKSGSFKPLDVSYAIVNECGASIYSCSEEAKKEFPNMDYNIISAISIARRLQDPLAELVKIEPKHLGVGMYQHDLPEKQLDATLNEVVIEAVSFVGVDVNTTSLCLLKRIAGLTLSRAKSIIDWRNQNGCFTNRKQLLDVKGIGSKTYEQCAGFIRIIPETVKTSSKSFTMPFNYLDQTWIHPESYNIANKIIKNAGCDVKHLGTEKFVETINKYAQQGNEVLAKRFNTEESTIDIIIKGLTTKECYDIRLKNDKPLFRKSLMGIEDLGLGIVLRGEVRNVTQFGAFVDVGIARDGLIPMKFMKGQKLGVGQRVQVKVLSIEKERNRICLELIEVY